MNELIDKACFADPDTLALKFVSDEHIFDSAPEDTLDIKTACYTLTSWHDEFYTYTDGRWFRLSDAEMRRKITNYLQRRNTTVEADEQVQITLPRVNNIMLCLKGRCGRSELTSLNSWPDGREKKVYTLPCKNGLVCWDINKKIKPVLMKHTPRFFNLYRLPYDYDATAQCPDWIGFLNDVMLGRQEYIDVLQKFVGYLFRPDLREQKFLLCYGEGANGKGVFFEVIQNLVGVENCSQVSLKKFNNRFSLFQTLGKIVNMTAESSHIIEDEAENTLKSYVAGDMFEFERKFKDSFSAVPTAKLIITTNALPRFRDKTQAIWRRIILVPFDKVVAAESQIRNLADILKKELPGVLNWALDGLEKLNREGFIIPESNKQLIEDYKKDCDPCRAFLADNYTESEDGYIDSPELYAHYCHWSKESGFEPVNVRLFGQQIIRVFPNVKRNQARQGSQRVYRYCGIEKHNSDSG